MKQKKEKKEKREKKRIANLTVTNNLPFGKPSTLYIVTPQHSLHASHALWKWRWPLLLGVERMALINIIYKYNSFMFRQRRLAFQLCWSHLQGFSASVFPAFLSGFHSFQLGLSLAVYYYRIILQWARDFFCLTRNFLLFSLLSS